MVLDNIAIKAAKGPALAVKDVQGLEVHRFADGNPQTDQPVIRLENVTDGLIQSCAAAAGTGTFLELKGPGNREIHLMGNRLARASREVAFVDSASESAIVRRS